MGWRGELEASNAASSQMNDWAGLSPDQEASLAALQVWRPSYILILTLYKDWNTLEASCLSRHACSVPGRLLVTCIHFLLSLMLV